MSWTVYFNVEPATVPVHASLRHDDGTIVEATALQHIDLVLPDSSPRGWGGSLTVSADGYVPQIIRVNIQDPAMKREDGSELTGLTLDVEAPAVLPGESGFLRSAGAYLVGENGEPALVAGYNIHTLLVKVSKGEEIDTLLEEAKSYGANCTVTLGMFMNDWYRDNGFWLDPRYPDYVRWLRRMWDIHAEHGMRNYHRVFQSAQALSDREQDQTWLNSCIAGQGRWNLMLAVGNECYVNGYDPQRFPRYDVGGVLLSKGSCGIGFPSPQGGWDLNEWEPRRDADKIYKCMDDAGAGSLELQHGYQGQDGFHGPFANMLIMEPPFFHSSPRDMYGDERWTDSKLALQLGLEIGSNNAGGAFGASLGLVGQPLDGPSAECARQFFRGLRAAFLR